MYWGKVYTKSIKQGNDINIFAVCFTMNADKYVHEILFTLYYLHLETRYKMGDVMEKDCTLHRIHAIYCASFGKRIET